MTFKKIEMNNANINKYKVKLKGLSHIRTGKDYKGYIYIDNEDNAVGFINMRISDKYIQAIEVNPIYQGQGIGKTLLNELIKMGAIKLSVNKNNTKAKKMYDKLFNVEHEDEHMYYMILKKSKYLKEGRGLTTMKSFSFKDLNIRDVTITENFNIINESNENCDDVIVKDISDINIITEGLFFTKKETYVNFDKFENGRYNFCLITGISGSGKSTIAKQLAGKYRAIYVELDIFYSAVKKYRDLETLGKKTNIVLYEYFKSHKSVYDNIKNHEYIQNEMMEKSKEFILYAISYAKKHKDKKFIIEGNELFECDNKSFASYPFIILNTSVLTTQLRTYKQERKNIKQLWKYMPSFFRNAKYQDKLVKAYKNKLLNESFEVLYEADDDLGPTDYNADDLGGGDDDTSDDGGGDDLGPTDYNEDDTTTDDTTDDTNTEGDTTKTDDDLDSLESDTDDPTTEPNKEGDDTGDVENSNDEQMNNDNDQDNENNKFLIKDYLELYNRLEEIMEKITSNETFKFSRDTVYNKARINIEKIKDMLFDYITLRFNNESYISNLYHFNMVIQAVNVNVAMIENSHTVTEIQNNIKKQQKTIKNNKNEKKKRS